MNISTIFSLFATLASAILHAETTINLAVDVPEKLQDGHGHCRCNCPKKEALSYVAEIDQALTTYIQMGQYDMMLGLVAPTATYTIVKPGRCTGCFKFQGELDPEVLWGCIDCYDFEPIDTTYYQNGVVIVRGLETVKKGKKTVFHGEVSRYYSADVGCMYRLELVSGSDARCDCCQDIGCLNLPPTCRMVSNDDIPI